MISKKCFCDILKASQEYNEKLDKLFDILNIQPENFLLSYLDSIFEALSNEVEIISEEDKKWLEPMIFSYAFSYNWGKSYKDSFLVKIDNVEYKPSTFEDLYDLLIKLYNFKESKT